MMKLSILDNGLRVASRAMPGVETVAIGLHAEAGSIQEPAEHNGIAHLFEHMLFKGAGGRSAREISEAIEDVGGDLNACTEREGTSFTASLLAEHLPLGIELLSDMVLRPHFNPSELEREKEVVLQELGEARDTPSDIIFDDLWNVAWPDQPLGRSILGSEVSIAAITADDLDQWRTRQYRAGSLALVAAGKVDHDELVRLAETRFAGLPEGVIDRASAPVFAGGTCAGGARADQAHLAFAWQGPAQLDPDAHAARLFADLVGGGASSRLFQAVREERGLAYSVWASLASYRDCGLFHVYAATSRREAQAASALIEEVVAKAARSPTQRELDRARIQARAGLLMSLETSWGQSAYLARMLSTFGRLVEPSEIVQALERVDLDQLARVGTNLLSGARAAARIGVPAVRAA
jgi:predicted Zn-dependent peptidase